MTKSCWVTHGYTESGDTLKILIFKNWPTAYQVNLAYQVVYPMEYEVNGGVHWELSESMLIDN